MKITEVGHLTCPVARTLAVIGDTTNSASRLEALTRDLSCDIVASDALVNAVGVETSEDGNEVVDGKVREQQPCHFETERLQIEQTPEVDEQV